MFRQIPVYSLAVLACCAAVFAQGNEGPTFVVASIKPAAPMQPGMIRVGMNGGPGTASPGQINVTNMNARDLMAAAFNVKDYQISGPDYIDSQRFDIIAKVPGGATKEDVQVMWQNLLKERFGLKLHHETKEMPMYALVVAKGGSKLKESDPTPAASLDSGPGGPDGLPAGAPPPPRMGKDGMPELPKSMRRTGAMGMMMMPGRMRMMGTAVTISRLVDILARQYDRPVVDQTGLTKTYDITLDFAPENMGGPKGMPMPPRVMDGGGGGGMAGPPPGGGGGDGTVRAPEGGEAPTLATALQEQLGLKLEPKKGPVDLLVIDHVEKTPTEN